MNAILYAEMHDLEFNLVSAYSNISTGIGWNEYFQPFCKEVRTPSLFFRVWPPVFIAKIFNLMFRLQIKLMYGFRSKINVSIWDDICNRGFEQGKFSSSKYGYKNVSAYEALHIVLKKIWQPNDDLNKLILAESEKYKNIQDCFAVHLRNGDKVSGITKETDAVDASLLHEYMTSLDLDFSELYILSDDYDKMLEFTKFFIEKPFSTHCDENQKGYSNIDFNWMPGHLRKNEITRLLVTIDFAVKAKYFIGPYSSNLSKLVYLLRNGQGCYNSEMQPFRIYY